MTDIDVIRCQQRTEAWFAARMGRLTGSCAATVMSKGNTRSKLNPYTGDPDPEGRRDLRAKLALERICGRSLESRVTSFAIQQGIEREPMARHAFEMFTREPVFESGFLSHRLMMAGASLDGYLGDYDELVSIKCRDWAEHMESIRSDSYAVPKDAMTQILHELWLTGAKAHHYVAFNPDFPPAKRLKVVTFKAKSLIIELGEYTRHAEQFLEEVDKEVAVLCAPEPTAVEPGPTSEIEVVL